MAPVNALKFSYVMSISFVICYLDLFFVGFVFLMLLSWQVTIGKLLDWRFSIFCFWLNKGYYYS